MSATRGRRRRKQKTTQVSTRLDYSDRLCVSFGQMTTTKPTTMTFSGATRAASILLCVNKISNIHFFVSIVPFYFSKADPILFTLPAPTRGKNYDACNSHYCANVELRMSSLQLILLITALYRLNETEFSKLILIKPKSCE